MIYIYGGTEGEALTLCQNRGRTLSDPNVRYLRWPSDLAGRGISFPEDEVIDLGRPHNPTVQQLTNYMAIENRIRIEQLKKSP